MKIKLTLSVMVPCTGEIEVEAESVEAAIEQLQADADERGWECDAWQNVNFSEDWSSAEKLGIEPADLPDGSITEYWELIRD